MRLVAGREFTAAETERGSLAVVINESFARSISEGRTRSAVSSPSPREGARIGNREIVGLVADARYNALRREVQPMFYAALGQLPRRVQSIEVRTSGVANPIAVGLSLRRVVAEVAPDSVVEDVRTMAQQVDRPIATERFIARVATAVGVLALALAPVGLYGLLSYLVALRTE